VPSRPPGRITLSGGYPGPAGAAGVALAAAALVPSGSVPYEVRTEHAAARALAAAGATTTRQQLGADIVRLLDQVWPVLREQGVTTGHNVVVYYGDAGPGTLRIDAGVEALTGFADRGEVRHVSTPSGEAATVAHYTEYSAMAPAYAALESWCAGNGRRPTGVSWEVYGDWAEDPAELRTDIYVLLEAAAP
jgi:effector-binding domain-containing protein